MGSIYQSGPTVGKGYTNGGYSSFSEQYAKAKENPDMNPYDYISQADYKNTERGRMQYQEDLGKLLYLAQINQENRMNEYNSPSNQVKRMREAGLNPDLQGVENVPATNVAGYQGNPLDGTQSALGVTGDVLGIVSGVTNIVGTIMSAGTQIFNPNNVLGMASEAVSLFESMPSNMNVSEFINSSNLSYRQKSRLKGFYKSYMNSYRAQSRNRHELIDNALSEVDFLKAFHNPYTSVGFMQGFEKQSKEFSKIWQPIIDAENEYMLKKLDRDIKSADYDRYTRNAYTGFRDTVDTNESINFQRETESFERSKRELWQHLRGPVNETLKELKKLDGKYAWAPYARSAVSALLISRLGL